jgi:hypothetical protein
MFPFTRRAAEHDFSSVADILAAAQNVAMEVPHIQPLPVIFPRSEWPLVERSTILPSDNQSVSPVNTTMQP